MSLVPNGRRRLMVAQAAPGEMAGEVDLPGVNPGDSDALAQGGQQTDPAAQATGGQDGVAAPNVEDPTGDLESEIAQQQGDQQAAGQEGDVRKTVFDFLVSLGYPPRRLMEFKSQFVSETGSANSGTQVTLVLPDEVYGKNVQIPREKLKELVQAVEQKHGLSFQDYKRANEQLTLNFMTADAAAQQSLENTGPGDILDKIYGKPGGKGGSKGKAPVKAETQQEMFKTAKDQQLNTLLKILGSKK